MMRLYRGTKSDTSFNMEHTVFNPENKEILTFGECLQPAMQITEQEDATQYLEKYVAYIQKKLDEEPRDDDMTAEAIAKANLGYFAGYYDNEVRARVEKLFLCSHPIFGKIEETGPITPEAAFTAGMNYAKKQES